jgi:hypothetical protein
LISFKRVEKNMCAKRSKKEIKEAIFSSLYPYPYLNLSLEDMEGEIWKPVPDFEAYYMVSNLGRIKRLARTVDYKDGRKARFLKERIAKMTIIGRYSTYYKEYRPRLSFAAITEDAQRSLLPPRVVYSAFVKKLGNVRKEKLFVLHRDLDQFNNKIENLFLGNYKEMSEHNLREGFCIIPFNLYSARENGKLVSSKKIAQYDLNGNFIRSFSTMRQAARQIGVSTSAIANVAREKQKHAGGFIWRYDEVQQLDSQVLSKYANPTQVRVNQYDADNHLVGSYRNIRRASQSLHYTESEYKQLKKHLRDGSGITRYKGFLWKYATL